MQITAFCITAAASGVMFVRWLRLDKETRSKVWHLYGWFTGLMFFGSCFGVFEWITWMNYLYYYFSLNELKLPPDVQFTSVMKAPSARWLSAFLVM
jgi:hypothetical protein